jgi:hypothetical protein
MKVFYLILFTVISLSAIAQKDTLINLPMQDGKIFYEHVYQRGMTKNDLFIKSKDVFLRLFPDTKGVIQDEDKENGIISGKGYFSMPMTMIKCTIRILVKDNKYKVQMFDFYSSSTLIRNDTESPIEKNYYSAKEKKQLSKRACNSWIVFNNNVLNIFNEIETEMNKKLSTDF